jgi:RNA methyltransferase, TrmH family
LKLVRALRQKKYRDQERLFLVQGRKMVTELLRAGQEPNGPRTRAVYTTRQVAEEWSAKGDLPSVLHVLPAHALDRLGTLVSGNEVVAVVEQQQERDPLPLAVSEMTLALDGVGDPGNMGTLLRVADWFGLAQVFCSPDCVEVYNPKCVQASMGSLFRVRTHVLDLPAQLVRWQQQGAAVYLADAAGRSVFDEALRFPSVLVLGAEAQGLSASVRASGGTLVSVPSRGAAESLNVAMAASALCMEFARCRP